MIKYVADSGIDIKKIDGVNFSVAPLTISTEERTFIDDETLNLKEMVEYMLSYKGKSGTACPSIDAWMKAFGSDEIADEIYVVTLTSGLSGTYQSACMARDMYQEKHPDTKILVVDSLSVGPEERLILEKMISLRSQGTAFEDMEKEILAYRDQRSRLFFGFESLHNLAQNGRVSRVVAAAVNALNITIVGTASTEGTIEALRKCRGKKKVVAGLIAEMKEAGYKGGQIYICVCEDKGLTDKLSEEIWKEWPQASIESYEAGGICSFYGERGGLILACECK